MFIESFSMTQFDSMTRQELIKVYQEVISKPPPVKARKEFLLGNISWHIQAQSISKNIEIYNHEVNINIKRCGFETKLIVNSEEQVKLEPHPDSLKAIKKGVRQGLEWNQTLVLGEADSAKEIAEKLNISDRYVCQCIRLAYLSPDNIKRIFKGDIPFDMTLTKLKKGFPLDWEKQKTLFATS